jgi:hypothetical protein
MQEKRPFLRGNNMSQDIPGGHAMQDGPGRLGTTTGNRGVPLAPSWEGRNVPEDQLNFRTLSVSMDRLDLELNPPEDR